MPILTATIAWLKALIGEETHDQRGFAISSETLLWIIGIVLIVGIVINVLNGYIQGLLAHLG
jgi:hypothetical protein